MAARHPKSALAKRAHGDSLLLAKKAVEPSTGTSHLIAIMKKELLARGGGGFHGLQRRFRIMDDDGSKTLSFGEFKKGLAEFNMSLSEPDLRSLFAHFDADDSGTIDFEEFVQGVRDPLSAGRLQLVHRAFNLLDVDLSGEVDAQEMALKYNTSKHPEVISGAKTSQQVLTEFLSTFEVGGIKGDGIVTRKEFANYYANLSASIDNDEYFELMMRNAWHLGGGKGAAANTSNLRVLVTRSSGVEEVVMVQDDLGLDPADVGAIYARMRTQGEDVVAIRGQAVSVGILGGKEVVQIGQVEAQAQLQTQGQGWGLSGQDFKLPHLDRPPRTKGSPGRGQGQGQGQGQGNSAGNQRTVTGKLALSPTRSPRANDSAPSPLRLYQEQLQAAAEQEAVVGTLLDVLRVQLGGGIIQLQRSFDAEEGLVDYGAFKRVLLQTKLAFLDMHLRMLFDFFDADGSGAIDSEELLEGLRGHLPAPLLALVHSAFDRMDKTASGYVDAASLISHFDAAAHPDVPRVRTEQAVREEFLGTLDVVEGRVSRDEFVRYYTNVALGEGDLASVLRGVWQLDTPAPAPAGSRSLAALARRGDESSLAAKLRQAQNTDSLVQRGRG